VSKKYLSKLAFEKPNLSGLIASGFDLIKKGGGSLISQLIFLSLVFVI
jgi:hypothetical protein